jgi:hypothetical protein
VPVSRSWGFDRGTPIDRYYIEQFLAEHGGDIQGRVLEIGDDGYTRQFGTSLESVAVLDVDSTNPRATLLLDLGTDSPTPQDAFDCIVCTQTLLLIYDVRIAIRNLHRMLAPSGVLLLTLPGISQICQPEMKQFGDFWRFTSASVTRLCQDVFLTDDVRVMTFGNVLTAASFLYGLSAEDLNPKALDTRDPDYQVLISARAVKRPVVRTE